MIKFIILGIVQGITEFLPISSSGHLVILQYILGIDKNVVFLDIVLHLGTLCATVIFFRKDISILLYNFFIGLNDIIFKKRMSYILKYDDKFKLSLHIIVITMITGFIVMRLKGFFEKQFENIYSVVLGLFIISIILFLTKNFDLGQRRLRHISLKDSILFSIAQVLAFVPGISRSGITISTLLFRNLDIDSAFKLSFLASVPAILGAFIIKFNEVKGMSMDIPLLYLFSGFFFAFISGIMALYVLRSILRQRNFYKFSYYCFVLSIVILFMKLRNFL